LNQWRIQWTPKTTNPPPLSFENQFGHNSKRYPNNGDDEKISEKTESPSPFFPPKK